MNNKNAKETNKKSFSVYGFITDRQVRNWFSKFRSDDTSLWNEPRPRCSLDLHQDAFRELVVCNLRKSTRELAFDLNTSQSSICYHSKNIGKVTKLGVSVVQILCEKKLTYP